MSESSIAPSPHGSTSQEEPWLGLESYREEDHGLFFGRAKEAEEVRRMIRREVLTILFGPAGIGKTSLINAGILPKLRNENCLPIWIRLDHSAASPPADQQIRTRITEALRSSEIDGGARCPERLPEAGMSLWEYLHCIELWDKRNQLCTPVLFLDQFEEVFTLGKDRPETDSFLAGLADLVENYVPEAVRRRLELSGATLPFPMQQRYKVVLSLREDYVHRLDALRRVMPSVMHNRYALSQMNGEQALEAVLSPGRNVVSEAVANQIVRFVAAARMDAGQNTKRDQVTPLRDLQIEPALLSVVCREHNARRIRARKPAITAEQIEAAQTDILNDFYERSFDGLPQQARLFVEDRLLTASGFRNTAPLEDARQACVSDEHVAALVNRRLIRIELRLGSQHLELTHDLLTKVVQASRSARQEREKRAKEEHVRAEQERQRRSRRNRRLMLVFGLAAVLNLLLALFAVRSWVDAHSRELAAYANSSLADDPQRSLAFAVYAIQATSRFLRPAVPQAEESMHRALLSSHLRLVLQPGGPVAGVAFSKDGRLVATASDKTGTLWDALSGQKLSSLSGHAEPITGIVFSPDGKMIATASQDKTARVWEPASGKELLSLGHEDTVTGVAFSPDNNRLATGCSDHKTRVWEAATGKKLLTVDGHGEGVNSVAFSPDGKWLATASNDRTVKLWDSVGGRELRTFKGHTQFVNSVAFSPNGDWLATASSDGTAKLWKVDSGKELLTIKGHRAYVQWVAFSPDGKTLATASGDQTARIWDTSSGEELLTLSGHQRYLSAVVFSADGTRLATASNDGTAGVWDAGLAGGELLTIRATAYALALRPDGKWLGATEGANVRFWEPGSGQESTPLKTNHLYVSSVAFSPDGKVLATGGDAVAKLWDADSRKELLTLSGHEASVSGVAFSPDGKRLATASGDKTAKLWNAVSGALIATLSGHRDYVSAAIFSPDGKRVATASGDGTAKLWNANSGRVLATLSGHEAPVSSVAFSPDGKHVGTASDDATARLWDADSGRLLATLRGHQGGVSAIAFSPDGERIATAGADATVKLWDAVSGRPLLTLRGHRDYISAMAFSTDGERLVTASRDRTIQVYALAVSEQMKLARHRPVHDLSPGECAAYKVQGCPERGPGRRDEHR